MTAVIIVLAFYFEKLDYVRLFKKSVQRVLQAYIDFFLKERFQSTFQMRLYFLGLVIPIFTLLVGLMIITSKIFGLLYFLLNFVAYLSCVDFSIFYRLREKDNIVDLKQVVYDYSGNFFACSFWFVALPGPLGVVLYFILVHVSDRLKANKQELLIYNLVIDKMLFWLNLFPYSLLSVMFALVGNFERVISYLLDNFKYKISSFYLENFLFELSLSAVDKKQVITDDYGYQSVADCNNISKDEVYSVVALLYRCTVLFVLMILMLNLSHFV
jgi:membrane protein required for beta-lactamase induction